MEKPVELMGHINPDVAPLQQKQHVFNPGYGVAAEEVSDGSIHAQEKSFEKTTAYIGETEDTIMDEEPHLDPYVPFDDLPEERRVVLTVRAVILGAICGALVGASNIYLGLKSGWTFTANLLGAIIGFAVIKPLSRAIPEYVPILGGSFGPRENNIVQTVATAAGGLGNVFVGGIPALYKLNLLSTPKEDFARLVTLTIVGGYFGFAFGAPLRKFFIIYVARELRLVFPTASATAMTIRSMHLATTGEALAKMKLYALSAAFSGAFILRIVSQYALGILWDWHFFTWIYIWSGYSSTTALDIENWGWYLEFTPAFIGSGMLVGLNPAISFFGGSVLSWAIIGPALIAQKMAFAGHPYGDATDPESYDPQWSSYSVYFSLSKTFTKPDHPSPRYWLLWPGIMLMIVVSFVELALQYKVFLHVCRAIGRGTSQSISAALAKRGKSSAFFEKHANKEFASEDELVQDPAAEEDQVTWWMWAPLLLMSIIGFCLVLGVQFGMPVGESLLCVILAFFFSFLAIQCTGVTDITPLTAAAKASQIVLGGATKGQGWDAPYAQRLNLLGGSLASMGAEQATNLVVDYRVGFLLRTPPKQQWWAQAIGTIVCVVLSPALFILFTQAYPCIISNDPNAKCPFQAPSVGAWKAVAEAMTDPTFPVPSSSGIFALVFGIFGGVMVLIRHYGYRGKWAKLRDYHPNMMCIGLAMVVPQTVYGTAMLMGAVVAYLWSKRSAKHFDTYGFAVAAGLIAGEGIGGVVNAIFQIAGIAGPDPYGTQIACPVNEC
ncbi:oligopeptide transporter [Dissoconium aciculare CBS 342.82]|uniref:Oligopeptide transporter n=1 Tax=Dissoconium aciculare CBS 342.82 TaxID=1314786 RepID=A0A6J3LV40_9PEZI|nr:oligopeptide transporter [Dissoconium aciculare CBS 342.82]KAF1819139.1 oligopeptide transporter [Dissoconium aciculare CBS 342.82]